MLSTLFVLMSTSVAQADEGSCKSCCQAAGITPCVTKIRVVGDDTLIVSRSTGYEAIGLFVSECGGTAFFEVGESAIFDHPPLVGEVATEGLTKDQLRCFAEHCSFPGDTCPNNINGYPVLARCSDGAVVHDSDISKPGKPKGPIPVKGAAPVAAVTTAPTTQATTGYAQPTTGYAQPTTQATTGYAQPTTGYAQPTTGYAQPTTQTTVAPAPTPYALQRMGAGAATTTTPAQPTTGYAQPTTGYAQPTTGYAQPTTGYAQPTTGYAQPTTGYAQPTTQATTGYAQPTTGYAQPTTGYAQPTTGYAQPTTGYAQPTTQATTGYAQPTTGYAQPVAQPTAAPSVDVSAPKRPASGCKPAAEALAKEARRQVSVGNDAEIAGELQKAADAYRAAITMDSCSAFGWAALGTLAMRVNRPDQAIAALEVAIELQPSHYGAATDLGRAYEALGNRQRAIDAYRAALKARPGHPAASQGLARLGAS